jgi:hypothetical protein
VDNIHPFLRSRVVSARVFGNLPPNFFRGCHQLVSVEGDVKTIGERAFADCFRMTSVTLPLVTHVEEEAFYGCTSLTSVDLPKATHLGRAAFWNCVSLTSVNLPKATHIGTMAFQDCPLTSIDLPLATHIDGNAFFECTRLKTVNLPLATHIDRCTFGSIKVLIDPNLERCNLTLVNIPLVTIIEDDAFVSCTLETVICFDTARIDALAAGNIMPPGNIMSEENRTKSIELSKTCKLIYDLTDKAVEWLNIRSRMRVVSKDVDYGNPVARATEYWFAPALRGIFKQLHTKVESLPDPVQQIWKQYVNDKIEMYHVDITFVQEIIPGSGKTWLRF